MNNSYYFMRHGQSLANLKHLVISSPDNGVKYYGLSAIGKKQTLESISKNKDLNKNTIIYSSDFKRAKETAEIVSAHLKSKEPILRKELRERFLGVYEKGKDNMYHKLWEEDLKGKTLQSVEPVTSVAKRIEILINEIEKKYKNKNILLITHGDIVSIGLSVLYNVKLHKHHTTFSLIKNAEIIKVKPRI